MSIAALRVVEPEQQSVAELLHHARRVGQRARTSCSWRSSNVEREVVAVLVGELREPDDVGEDDRPREGRRHRHVDRDRRR